MMKRLRTIIRLGVSIIRLRLRCVCLARWHRRLGWGLGRRLVRRGWRRLCVEGDFRTSARLRRRRSIWCLRRGGRVASNGFGRGRRRPGAKESLSLWLIRGAEAPRISLKANDKDNGPERSIGGEGDLSTALFTV